MRQIVPQMNQRGDQAVHEDQLMPGTGPRSPSPGPAACFMTAPLDTCLPRPSQLLSQAGEMTPTDPREQLMRENRPVDHDRHTWIMPATSNDVIAAITHQLVSGRHSPLLASSAVRVGGEGPPDAQGLRTRSTAPRARGWSRSDLHGSDARGVECGAGVSRSWSAWTTPLAGRTRTSPDVCGRLRAGSPVRALRSGLFPVVIDSCSLRTRGWALVGQAFAEAVAPAGG